MKTHNILKFLYFKFWLFMNYLKLLLSKVHFHNDLEIRGLMTVKNLGSINIGHNVRINSSMSSNPIGGGWKTNLQCLKNAKIIIGNGVRMSNISITSRKSVEIGNNVFIGDGVGIFDTDFHPLDMHSRILGREGDVNTKSLPVSIKNGVFIGTRSLILKGVEIGENSIIGAGSIVTKSIPANEIWAGNPAKMVKKL